MADPIEASGLLATSLDTLDEEISSELNEQNQIYNINNEILVKQDQLEKIKNDNLENQIEQIKTIESSIINKDRLIEQTYEHMQKNDKNIYILYLALSFSIVLMLVVYLYSLGKLNDKAFTACIVFIIVVFILMVMYKYNILFFRTVTHFVENRKNLALINSVKDLGSQVQSNMQERLYGDKQDFLDENCICPVSEDYYAEEEDVAVDIKPGYFYYDKNAPKQLLVPNGGDKIDVSATDDREVYDKIDWVNHDQVMYELNDEESGHYQIEPNDRKLYTNGKLVNDSTYTVNL